MASKIRNVKKYGTTLTLARVSQPTGQEGPWSFSKQKKRTSIILDLHVSSGL